MSHAAAADDSEIKPRPSTKDGGKALAGIEPAGVETRDIDRANAQPATTQPSPTQPDAGESSTAEAERAVAHPIPSPQAPEPVQTQATYRLLTMRGLAPNEAANITAYLVGLQVHKTAWTLVQVNRMLFLREVYRKEHPRRPQRRRD